MLKIIFRVDASMKMGIGHLMRCLTLAEELERSGHYIEFICRNHRGNLIALVESKGFIVRKLKKNTVKNFDLKLFHSSWLGVDQKTDAEETIFFLRGKAFDVLIVDHYALDIDWENEVSQYTSKIIVIDDLADRVHNCDFLIDQTYGIVAEKYKKLVPNDCTLLLGSNYALLRPEFRVWRNHSLERRKIFDLKNILITMGGNDQDNYSLQILEKLNDCQLSNELKIIVILGPNSQHLESVSTFEKFSRYNIKVKTNVINVAELMSNSDLAIGASGSTTWERCCLGLPSIQISIASNQEVSSKILASKNVIKLLNSLEELPKLVNTFNSWSPDLSIASAKICDGLGANRVIKKILGVKNQ